MTDNDLAARLAAAMDDDEDDDEDYESDFPELEDGPYRQFLLLGRDGIVMLFGESKVGKTKIACTIAMDAAEQGHQVIFFDVERNIDRSAVRAMKKAGVDYQVMDKLKFVQKECKAINRGKSEYEPDLVIIDSISQEITGRWGDGAMTLRDKGDMLTMVQNIGHNLAKWASREEKMALIVAQPISSFGDRKRIVPMGDKLGFFCKEVLMVKRPDESKPLNGEITAWGSRVLAPSVTIAEYKTRKLGVEFNKFTKLLEELE